MFIPRPKPLAVIMLPLAKMKRGNSLTAVAKRVVDDFFFRAIYDFKGQYPDITFGLFVVSTDHVAQQIATEQAHIRQAYNVGGDPRVRVETSGHQPLVALVRPHDLCRGDAVVAAAIASRQVRAATK